jgi:AmmeMemoRadiSam system protein B
LAGTWYPGPPKELAAQVDGFLNAAAPPNISGRLIALVAPHAGYRYSGPTAGYAFRCLQGEEFPLVAVLSPYHSFNQNDILTSGHRSYRTPLGDVTIDRDAIDEFDRILEQGSGSTAVSITHDTEHAIEIELPFLQRALAGKFDLLPLMLPGGGLDTALAVGTALAGALKGRIALLVASTDLSHYRSEAQARKMDECMIEAILTLSPQALLDVQSEGEGYACGAVPLAAVVASSLALGADSASLLHYSTSADQSGDRSSVVGYAAVAIYRNAAG